MGYINSIQIEEKHGYINLTQKQPDSVKIHFAESFRANSKSEFEKMYIIKEYVEKRIANNEDRPSCCCVGEVKYVKNGVNIIIDNHKKFIIDGLTFCEIIDAYNSMNTKRQ